MTAVTPPISLLNHPGHELLEAREDDHLVLQDHQEGGHQVTHALEEEEEEQEEQEEEEKDILMVCPLIWFCTVTLGIIVFYWQW